MSLPPTSPGSCFRFVVANADEAATVIRERLGPDARVLSVRTLPSSGILGLFSAPRIEVVAHVPSPEPEAAPAPAPEPVPETPAPVAADPRVRAARERWREPAGDLAALLTRSGFSAPLLARLQQDPAWPRLAALPLHRALADTGRLLRYWTQRRDWLPLSRAAFLGAPGVGRTTALCKWLGAEVFQRGRFGHVVTAEFDRPLAPGPLPVFCEALGVPVAHYPAATRPATPGGFVYFDLPGISVARPADNAALAAFLDREEISQRVLVLNAAYDHAALRAAYAAGRELGATHVVFTHLDEVPQWGRLWDYLLDGGPEPLFLATGPSLTGDLETDPGEALARRTLPPAAPTPAAVLDSAA